MLRLLISKFLHIKTLRINGVSSWKSALICFQLDTARTSAAGASPMMSAIHDLIPYIDEESLNDLCGEICEQLRTSVGLSTRTGTAQFVTNLCLRRQQLLIAAKPCCGKVLSQIGCKRFLSILKTQKANSHHEFGTVRRTLLPLLQFGFGLTYRRFN